MPPPPHRLPPSSQRRRVLGSPKAVLMLRTTARALAIRSAIARPALAQPSSSDATAISTRSMRVGWCAAPPSPLARAASEPVVRYEYQGQTFTLDDYLARNPATGLLVARGDTILIERYQYARHDRHRFMSWSMAKTVTGMLIGIAIAEGRIRSADEPAAAYVPALADTEYGRTSLRHCFRCRQACASSRSTRERTTCRGSRPTRFDRLVPAVSKR